MSLCALALSGTSSPVLAADDVGGPPARIDNVYDGFDHQPTHSEVSQREQVYE
jgi:hypothetical protein